MGEVAITAFVFFCWLKSVSL